MLRLLIIRASPLLLRPSVVLLEGHLVTDGFVLVWVLPISMLALAISSFPVHIEYFRATSAISQHADEYISALSWLTVISIVIMFPLLLILPLDLNLSIVIATCATFFIEKLADEVSRSLEFQKQFANWLYVQLLRSGWFFFPIMTFLLGYTYTKSFLVFSLITAIVMFFVFLHITGLMPRWSGQGLRLINKKSVFLLGSCLPASYRHLPRLVAAKVFPEQVHIYLAVAQLCQGIGLLFNVRYNIPYRKIIARRTQLFQNRLRPLIRRLVMPISLIAAIYIVISPVLGKYDPSYAIFIALLVPIIVADTLNFTILSLHFGYIPWFCDKWNALITYSICALMACIVIAMIMIIVVPLKWTDYVSIYHIPAGTIMIGLMWLVIITQRHFLGNVRSE